MFIPKKRVALKLGRREFEPSTGARRITLVTTLVFEAFSSCKPRVTRSGGTVQNGLMRAIAWLLHGLQQLHTLL